MKKIEMIDLKTPYKEYREGYIKEISKVLDDCAYIGGAGNKYIEELENNLKHALKIPINCCVCNSGTTALIVALLAAGVSPGDEVILPDFNFIAGVEAVVLLGAKPVFVDVSENTYLMDFESAENAITHKTAAIIVTDLFGQFPDYSKLIEKVEGWGIVVIEDAAQSFGASNRSWEYACTLGHIAITSFYPVKPLGGFGEGGAIFSSNSLFIDRARIIINHGCEKKYNHIGLGLNGRLNAIQAVSINFKLMKYFWVELLKRNEIAKKYLSAFPEDILPKVVVNNPSWAQFTVKVPERDKFREFLSDNRITTDIHYPKPCSKQGIYGTGKENNTNSVFLSDCVVSLPIHPYLSEQGVNYVIETVLKYFERY